VDLSIGSCISAVFKIYEELDQQTDGFSRLTGLKCLDGCGACCESPNVEATVLELLPLAQEVYFLDREEEILEKIGDRKEREPEYKSCILYLPDFIVAGNGRCTYYNHRPLICRLFGFAARKNKYNHIEFSPCKKVRQKDPPLAQRVEMAIANGARPPLFQESAFRVASLMPSLGFKRYPINRALWEALAYLSWKKPVKPKHRKAA